MKTILWFRQDLRLRDNPALRHAVESGSIIPVYILDDCNPQQWQIGDASAWWLHHSLLRLQEDLDHQLLFFRGDPVQLIPRLAASSGADTVVWNRCYEPWQIQRDRRLKILLKDKAIACQSFNSALLWEPWTISKKDGAPYKVFTPFYRKACLPGPQPRMPLAAPKQIRYSDCTAESLQLDELALVDPVPWHQGFRQLWQPGEAGAAQALSRFIATRMSNYKTDRDIPGIAATSRLSPHLHFGEISPQQVWYAALQANLNGSEDLDCFMSELAWREFSYYLLYHFPTLPEKNFRETFNVFPWHTNAKHLSAWQRGQTGIPIVDAGMRELWQTGYMHNRVRMIVASFLVKNLLIDWREGAAWFWDCLLDADLASNSASWQWVAGSGADAAPYFRIFNPVTQGEKFDPQGAYVKRFCPELGSLPDKFIHRPWDAPDQILEQSAIVLGKHYPCPLVDLQDSRQRALDAYKAVKDTASQAVLG